MSRKLFVDKVFELVNDPSMNDIIHWTDDGDSFVVADSDRLANQVFPEMFKHSSMDSFIRQLHHYGFKKNGKDKASLEFSNSLFLRGRPELISSIKRKAATKAPAVSVTVEVDDLLAQINALKSEKEHLQSENENLREKYAQLVSKVEDGSDAGFVKSESPSDSFFGMNTADKDVVWNTPTAVTNNNAGFNFADIEWGSPMEIEDLSENYGTAGFETDNSNSTFDFLNWNSSSDSFGTPRATASFVFRAPSLDLNDSNFGFGDLFPVKSED